MAMPRPSFIYYQEEATYGAGIDSGEDAEWIGLVNPFSGPAEQEYKEWEFLGAYDTGTTSTKSNVWQVGVGGKPIDISFTYAIQKLDLRKFAMGHDASFNFDTVPSMAFVAGVDIAGTMNFIQYKGFVVESWELKFPERDIATATARGKATDFVAPTTVDPMSGVGNYVAKDSDDPYMTADIDSVKIGTAYDPAVAVDHYITDMTLLFENKIDQPYDINETTWAQIAEASALRRDISITLDVRYADFDWEAYVRNKTNLYLKIAVEGEDPSVTTTFNTGAFKLPLFDNELKPGEYYGGPVTFLGSDASMNVTQA